MSSPLNNLNKGYAKQEKSDLMNDNPIAKHASGGSYISKHMSGSPLSKLDPMHNGEPGVQKEDFDQYK